MRIGLTLFMLICLGTTGTLGCGALGEDKPLKAKLFNQGQYPLTGYYFQPKGTIPETGWEAADWGQNHLTVAQLAQNEFVIVTTLKRLEYDGMASFGVGGTTERLRGAVLANWIHDGEIITIMASWSDGGTSFGYQWGLQEFPDEVDVTPP